MAKRSSSSSNNFVRGCAYVALLIAAFTFLFSGLVYSLDIGVLTRFCWISSVAPWKAI